MRIVSGLITPNDTTEFCLTCRKPNKPKLHWFKQWSIHTSKEAILIEGEFLNDKRIFGSWIYSRRWLPQTS